MRRVFAAAAALLATAPLLAGCSADDEPRLTVLAAASLTEAFEALEVGFEREHGVDVEFSFGSSTTLAQQAAEGAPGDLLATADSASMELAAGALADDPQAFAGNRLVLVAHLRSAVRTWRDLADARWARCADDVPCGQLARALLEQVGAVGEPASLEVDVKAVLGKVVSGEADAGFVYASDAVAAGSAVREVPLPGQRLETRYLVAPLRQAEDAELARAWVELLRSPAGHEALVDAGFSVVLRG